MWCPLGVAPALECREGRSLFDSPQHPDVAQLPPPPARGNGSGAEGLVVVPRKQGRKDTTGGCRSCERSNDLPESFGLGADASLLTRSRRIRRSHFGLELG